MKINEIIRKVKGGYRLYSHSGKNLGTYPSRAGAEKRERQVQYFKHKESVNYTNEVWSEKYKRSINCAKPKGFSQKAHCAGRKKKNEDAAGVGIITKQNTTKDVKPGDEYKNVKKLSLENFADGRGPGRPGDSQRHGIPKNATMAQLQKAAKAPGRKGQLARWQINMRRGRKKAR